MSLKVCHNHHPEQIAMKCIYTDGRFVGGRIELYECPLCHKRCAEWAENPPKPNKEWGDVDQWDR